MKIIKNEWCALYRINWRLRGQCWGQSSVPVQLARRYLWMNYLVHQGFSQHNQLSQPIQLLVTCRKPCESFYCTFYNVHKGHWYMMGRVINLLWLLLSWKTKWLIVQQNNMPWSLWTYMCNIVQGRKICFHQYSTMQKLFWDWKNFAAPTECANTILLLIY